MVTDLILGSKIVPVMLRLRRDNTNGISFNPGSRCHTDGVTAQNYRTPGRRSILSTSTSQIRYQTDDTVLVVSVSLVVVLILRHKVG